MSRPWPRLTQLGQEEWALQEAQSASQRSYLATPQASGADTGLWLLVPSKKALPGAGRWGKPALLAPSSEPGPEPTVPHPGTATQKRSRLIHPRERPFISGLNWPLPISEE